MRLTFGTVLAATAVMALTAGPVLAQGHGGGHARGGGRSGGGHVTRGAVPRAGGGHVAEGRRAVPRPPAVRPHVDRPTTIIRPDVHLGIGSLALGLGRYAYPYGYGNNSYGYGYPGYYSGYPARIYGGYGRASHARLRILGAQRDAEVYVDGYYVGIVDDFDGIIQHLELTPGPHQVEIRAGGFAPISFDVRAESGRTITYRAQMVP